MRDAEAPECLCSSLAKLENHAFEAVEQFRGVEIQNLAYPQLGDPSVSDHLCCEDRHQVVDTFHLHDDGARDDSIRDVVSNPHTARLRRAH